MGGCGGGLFWSKHFAEARPKKYPTWNTRKKGHGGPPAEWPPPQVSENLKSYEAVERGAVTDSRKNLIGKGCGLLSDRTGELLTHTDSNPPQRASQLPSHGSKVILSLTSSWEKWVDITRAHIVHI